MAKEEKEGGEETKEGKEEILEDVGVNKRDDNNLEKTEGEEVKEIIEGGMEVTEEVEEGEEVKEIIEGSEEVTEEVEEGEKVEEGGEVKDITEESEEVKEGEEVEGEDKVKDDGEVKEKKPEPSPTAVTSKKKGLKGILHIYSSQNNTILHVTDITGAETITIQTAGSMVKADKDNSTPYAAMLAASKIIGDLKDRGVKQLNVKIRAPGGHNGPVYPGKGAVASIKAISRSGIEIGQIEDVTPIPQGGCRPKGGKRGRRV